MQVFPNSVCGGIVAWSFPDIGDLCVGRAGPRVGNMEVVRLVMYDMS